MTSCTITRQCILDSSDFLACYELLLKEVICPHLKSNLIEELSQTSQPNSYTTDRYRQYISISCISQHHNIILRKI